MGDTAVDAISRREYFEMMISMLAPGRLADLGAGHGGFSMAAADLGWQVTAIDARAERWPVDDRITWVNQDIRKADLSGQDVVACLGLFYHLTLADQLALLTKCSGKPLILDTHVTCEGNTRSKHLPNLSDQVQLDGYLGRYYTEDLSSPLASWGNEKSFWPDMDSLHRMLTDSGYRAVMALDPWYEPDRTFFLCLPGRRRSGQGAVRRSPVVLQGRSRVQRVISRGKALQAVAASRRAERRTK